MAENNWGQVYCTSHWGDESNKDSVPPNQFNQCAPAGGPYVFLTKPQLQTGVDLWISDRASAISTYGQINTWNVTAITNMFNLFNGETTFNDDISSWDVSNVTTMNSMFRGATSFNQDISGWNIGSLNEMQFMFYDAYAFNQNLSSWNVSSVVSMRETFKNSGLSTINYSAKLSSWSSRAVISNVELGLGTIKYSASALSGRNTLTSTPNDWQITDGGQA
tara:strand:- start:277 stop:936 length:660 start_codon:yes stop_codon:yes gene_type:complete